MTNSVKLNSEMNLLGDVTNQKMTKRVISLAKISMLEANITLNDSCKAVLIQFITMQRTVYCFLFCKAKLLIKRVNKMWH